MAKRIIDDSNIAALWNKMKAYVNSRAPIGAVAAKDVVPVEMGGTGGVNAGEAIENLGLSKVEERVLLWENEQLTSEFSAQLLPVVGVNEYDEFIIRFATDLSSGILPEIRMIKNRRGLMSFSSYANTTSEGVPINIFVTYRRFLINDVGVNFEDAYYFSGTANGNAILSKRHIIPDEIYGVRRVN